MEVSGLDLSGLEVGDIVMWTNARGQKAGPAKVLEIFDIDIKVGHNVEPHLGSAGQTNRFKVKKAKVRSYAKP